MKNYNSENKSASRTSTTPSRQRTISSYMPSALDNYSSIKDWIIEACVEFCTLDGRPFDTVIGEGFINNCLHFVDDNYYLRIFILACKLYDLPNLKAYSVRYFVNAILEQFGLKYIEDMFVISDNEQKMVCALKDDTTRVGCSTHYINKILEHAFELDESLGAGV